MTIIGPIKIAVSQDIASSDQGNGQMRNTVFYSSRRHAVPACPKDFDEIMTFDTDEIDEHNVVKVRPHDLMIIEVPKKHQIFCTDCSYAIETNANGKCSRCVACKHAQATIPLVVKLWPKPVRENEGGNGIILPEVMA